VQEGEAAEAGVDELDEGDAKAKENHPALVELMYVVLEQEEVESVQVLLENDTSGGQPMSAVETCDAVRLELVHLGVHVVLELFPPGSVPVAVDVFVTVIKVLADDTEK
jgi:hypothetical protein